MTFNPPPLPSPTQNPSTRRGGFLGILTTLPGILTSAEHRWTVALLQALTFLWAVVAGVTARDGPPAPPP